MNDDRESTDLLILARKGDQAARESLLGRCRGIVTAATARWAGRPLSWGRDEELSVGLLAVNQAIDAFEPGRNVSFAAFCHVVIRRRLIDHYRRMRRPAMVSLDALEQDLETSSLAEAEACLSNYRREQDAWEYGQEIELYRDRLKAFDIDLDDLADHSPRRAHARERLLHTAALIARDPGLMDRLEKTKRVPQARLCTMVNVTPRALERGRKYLIAMAVLMASPDLPLLRSHLEPAGSTGHGGLETGVKSL